MKELKELESKIVDRLQEIRNMEQQTANELDEYAELQKKLREIHNVMIYLERMN